MEGVPSWPEVGTRFSLRKEPRAALGRLLVRMILDAKGH